MSVSMYRFPLAIQTVLPEAYRDNAEFARDLETLQKLGFSGIELNMAHPERVDLADVLAFLREFGLEFTMFASGLTAKTYGLSLSSDDDTVRQPAIDKCHELIEFVAGTGAGIIFGFFKGGPVPDVQDARARFKDSIGQLSPHAQEKQVKLLIEATNRYESAVANSLDDTVELIREFRNPFLRILPDTFHMNIEEKDGFAALTRHMSYYDSLHISDNTRYFPGFGAINFARLIEFLEARKYDGWLAIEGNLQRSFRDDVAASVAYLSPFLSTEE